MHWTYRSFNPEDDLEQGDIIEPNAEMLALFQQVHPHFCDPKYLTFIIVSQTCDLVRRSSGCKARHLSLAVVRSISAVMPRLLDEYAIKGIEGVYRKSRRRDTKLLLTRIINQNEQAAGIFYLHPDADAGIGEHAVAMLRVSIAVRAEHYHLLCHARRGRLVSEFQMKLGWLTGNLYSRVATPDWPETTGKNLVDEILRDYDEQISPKPVWLDDKVVDEISRGQAAALQSRDTLLAASKTVAIPSPRTVALDVVKRVLTDVVPDLKPESVKRVLNRLQNDAQFSSACKP